MTPTGRTRILDEALDVPHVRACVAALAEEEYEAIMEYDLPADPQAWWGTRNV